MAKARLRLSVFLTVLIALAVIYLPGYTKLQILKAKGEKLDAEIRRLEAENKELQKKKDRLEKDPTYVERVAREKMGMIKKGELRYKIMER